MVNTKKTVKSADEQEPIGEVADTAPVAIPEAGAVAQNEEFAAVVDQRGTVSVKPTGWVGPAPLQISAHKVPALISVLQELSASPEEPESDD